MPIRGTYGGLGRTLRAFQLFRSRKWGANKSPRLSPPSKISTLRSGGCPDLEQRRPMAGYDRT